MSKQNKKKRNPFIIFLKILMVPVVLVLIVYGMGVYYFNQCLIPGTVINGINCSFLSEEDAYDRLNQKVSAYVLEVDTRNNGVEALDAISSGLSVKNDQGIKELMFKQSFWWPLPFITGETMESEAVVSCDETALRKAVSELECMQASAQVAPVDAYIFDDGFSKYEIVSEIIGSTLDVDKTVSAIKNALLHNEAVVNLETEDCYVNPKIYSDTESLVADCERMNQLTGVTVTYDFSPDSERVNRALIGQWLVKDANGTYQADRNQVRSYIASLAEKYDTKGDIREFVTYDGARITLQAGEYGWQIDVEAETDQLIDDLENGRTQVREPIYVQKGMVRRSGNTENDIGYTYLEIDISNSRMVYYVQGQPVVDTKVMTGVSAFGGNGTPLGAYTVLGKEENAEVPGEKFPSRVNYYLPFTDEYGICDATWQVNWTAGEGEALTQTDGVLVDEDLIAQGYTQAVETPTPEPMSSNMPRASVVVPSDSMAALYSRIEEGTPVIIYQRDGTEQSAPTYNEEDTEEE